MHHEFTQQTCHSNTTTIMAGREVGFEEWEDNIHRRNKSSYVIWVERVWGEGDKVAVETHRGVPTKPRHECHLLEPHDCWL